jgi:hypothetical protein
VTTRDDRIGFAAIAFVVVGTVALAQWTPGAAPPAGASAADAAGPCAEWTDGCVVCQRIDGEEHCSMPGIACVRGATQCLRR